MVETPVSKMGKRLRQGYGSRPQQKQRWRFSGRRLCVETVVRLWIQLLRSVLLLRECWSSAQHEIHEDARG